MKTGARGLREFASAKEAIRLRRTPFRPWGKARGMVRLGRPVIRGAMLAVGLASSAWGYGYLGLGLGSGVFQASARCAGMGEIAVLGEGSPLAVTLNPALLGYMKESQAAFSYRGLSLNENWSSRVHDSFDGMLGYNTYAANSHIYHEFSGGVASGAVAQALGACFAVALVPAFDFRYDFHQEIRDRSTSSQPPDRVIAQNFVRGTGQIRSLSFGLGTSLLGPVAIGAGVDYLFGERGLEVGITFEDRNQIPAQWTGADSSSIPSPTSLSGVRFGLGAAVDLGERLRVGGTFKSKVKLDGDFGPDSLGVVRRGTTVVVHQRSLAMEYPASYSLGVSDWPVNGLISVAEAGVTLSKWSDVADFTIAVLTELSVVGTSAARLHDAYEWHLGVEHVFYNGRPLRFGFYYRPSPNDKETSEAAMTAGTGFGVAGFDVDLAAKVGWRQYREYAIFDDHTFGAKPRTEMDQVTETVTGGTVTISRRF